MPYVNTDKLLQTENDKWQTRPLVREGSPQRQNRKFQTTTFAQTLIYGHKSQSGLDTSTYWLTDWLNFSRNVTSTSAVCLLQYSLTQGDKDRMLWLM
jgi:hypothetical protein